MNPRATHCACALTHEADCSYGILLNAFTRALERLTCAPKDLCIKMRDGYIQEYLAELVPTNAG